MELAEFLEELHKTHAVGYRAYLHPNGEIWLISPEGHFHSPLTAVCAVKTGDEYGAGWTLYPGKKLGLGLVTRIRIKHATHCPHHACLYDHKLMLRRNILAALGLQELVEQHQSG